LSCPRTQRVRDPVHGLIVFNDDEPIDQLAWRLLDTPEFQRLRRIKQLGVSEFVFPNATHTRFAHCIGVFHTARKLVNIVTREEKCVDDDDMKRSEKRAQVAVIAALLHDLGHGPFSHTFEGVQKSRGIKKRHEKWTADIIRNERGQIRPLLDTFWPEGGFCEEIAELLESENPQDYYHAIVSSSFDADRLDYLQRDRLMTGTGAGAIDLHWLLEHVRVGEIEIDAPDAISDDDRIKVRTFCLDPKALPAAEQFLLARYTLHEQVYFHKTTRCVEHMIAKLLRLIADLAEDQDKEVKTGLGRDHPLLRFLHSTDPTIADYLALDDVVVMGAIERMTRATEASIANLAERLRTRSLYKTLDVQSVVGDDAGAQKMASRRIDQKFADKILAGTVMKDEDAAISIYTQIGGDDDQAHKKLYILRPDGIPVEIASVSKVVKALEEPKRFKRYYFEDAADRENARQRRERA
jgi:HD superfamily phosphohydrolase